MSQEPSSNSVSHRETREEGPPNSGERGTAQGMEPKKKISISEIEGVPVKITLQIGALQHDVYELEENQQFLLEQNNTIVAQLSKVESEKNEQKAENANLQKASENFGKAIENLNSQVEGLYRLLIQNAAEPKYEKLRELQQKKLTFLLEQNNRIVVQLSKGESERNELKKRIANLEKALKNIQCQVEELQRSKTKNATEPEGLETPVAQPPQDEVQGTGMWHRGAKCLLKVGLGLATAALIVPAAFWVFSKMFT